MSKITVVINDYASNVKSLVSFDQTDYKNVKAVWTKRDERLVKLHVLESFNGYENWGELTPEHYRILISRGLNAMNELSMTDRMQSDNETVAMTNFLILAFIISLETRISAEIEHFRINRFDETNVSFDLSASFDLDYDRPKAKNAPVEPSFSIVIDNND